MVILNQSSGRLRGHLDEESPTQIGLLPPSRAAQVISAGNAAGEGSKCVLVSKNAWQALRITE